LFRTFAAAGFGEDDALKFVNEFGLLGLKKWELDDRMDGSRSVPCELLGDWQSEVLAMRAAAGLWDALEYDNAKYLADSVMQFSDLEPSIARSCEVFAKPTGIPAVDDWILLCRCDDWIDFVRLPAGEADDRRAAARELLRSIVNERLKDHCALILHRRTEKSSPIKLAPRATPLSLLGAMWWQFARVIAGESSYRKCKACARYIEISAGAHGKPINREFCSDACRTRDNRRKVREAKALKAEGRTVPQIAKHFETSSETIRNWLTKKK